MSTTPAVPTNNALTVRASEWQFEPPSIELTVGQKVDITFENEGELVHNFKIDGLDADVIESSEDGDLFVEADEGHSEELVFTPEEGGTFTYYCTIPDHRDLGMEGALVILPGPAPTASGPGAPAQVD